MHFKLFLRLIVLSFTVTLSAQELTAFSINIRYNSNNDGDDLWELRKKEVVEHIATQKPSVFGVQEATHTQMLYLNEELPNYTYVGVGRDDGKTKGEYSAIFYHKGEVELIEEETFWLSSTPERVSKGWDAVIVRVCTYAKFKHIESERQFWHFNTHFDHIGQMARTESAILIREKIKSINREQLPVVLSGDFNALPEEQPIAELKKLFRDPLEDIVLIGPLGTFNGFEVGVQPDRRIDYIFSDGFNVKSYKHLDDKRKNGRWISDHLAVSIHLFFKEL
tara:strand:+ start:3510 stop:4346 length:837 start_codon:yes stop_codon:yes gene_type:complete